MRGSRCLYQFPLKGHPRIHKASLTSKSIAKAVAQYALDKKAEDIVILDMRKLVNFCDYFVLCSGTSDRHVVAIAEGVEEELKKLGVTMPFKDGLRNAQWVVYDAGDVVVHFFQKEFREFYNLEYLWQEAKQVKWD